MKCLVCRQWITIHRFNEMFRLESPLLCDECISQLKKGQGKTIFEANDWMNGVIDRLNRGDMILMQLFIKPLTKEIRKYLKQDKRVVLFNLEDRCPYPWMHLLVDEVKEQLTMAEQNKLKVDFMVDLLTDEMIRLK